MSSCMSYHEKLQKSTDVGKEEVDPLSVLLASKYADMKSADLEGMSECTYNPNVFLPANFERFVLTGEYQKFTDVPLSMLPGRMIFITGCGRSGTTLMFKLLSSAVGKNALTLNEPREIYLNADQNFDVWSKKASLSDVGNFNFSDLEKLKRIISHISQDKDAYIEKMPEHILRFSSLSKALPNASFIYMYRNWFEVASSIKNSFGPSFNWYGFNSAKWKALCSYCFKEYPHLVRDPSTLVDMTDMLTRGTIEWLLCQSNYERHKDSPQLLLVKYAEILQIKESSI